MGRVYRAHDEELDRDVALKVLARDGGSSASEGATRLVREAQALAKLNHPNVIAIYDVAHIDDTCWSRWSWSPARPCRNGSGRRPRWREIVKVFREAGRGLAAAHAAGLVHRDFKPANVLHRRGRARARRSTSGSLVRPGWREPRRRRVVAESAERQQPARERVDPGGSDLGTPAYMAPEQHRGEPVDARSDQFSFCVALYGALYGVGPFPGEDAKTHRENLLAGRLRETPASADVPAWVRRVVVRGLSVAPTQRWPSMNALLDELASAIRRHVVGESCS